MNIYFDLYNTQINPSTPGLTSMLVSEPCDLGWAVRRWKEILCTHLSSSRQCTCKRLPEVDPLILNEHALMYT